MRFDNMGIDGSADMRLDMRMQAEEFHRELTKYLREKGVSNDEEVDEAVKEFIEIYNRNKDQGLYDQSGYSYLKKAEAATNSRDRIRYAKKALELDPSLTDARTLLIKEQTINDPSARVEQLKREIQQEEERLREMGYTKEEDAGDFYGLPETRPYMRLLSTLANALDSEERYHEAAEVLEEVIYLNPDDNMGTRTSLIEYYAMFDEEEKALKLREQFDGEDSAFMLLPLVAMYYKRKDKKKAADYVRELASANDNLKAAVNKLIKSDLYDLAKLADQPFIVARSAGEIYIAYVSAYSYYKELPGFLPFIQRVLQGKTGSAARKEKSSPVGIDRSKTWIWSAKLVEKGRPRGYRYFSSEALRDAFVEENKAKGWRKYGAIEPENLEKHLKSERNAQFIC